MRPLLGDNRGGVSVITAGSLFAMLAATALAIDTGSLYLAKRKLQGAADAAALAAAEMPTDRTGAANRALTANGITGASVTQVTPGGYTPDATQTSASRFVPGDPAGDAAQVTLAQDVPLIFGRIVTGGNSMQIKATATAARIDLAAFSIGSRLASLQGGLPGALLSALAGTQVSLSVSDYNALASADVDVFAYASALRTRLGLTAGTFDDALQTQTSLPTAVAAIADAVGTAQAAAILRTIAASLPGTLITPSSLVDLDVYGDRDGAAGLPGVHIDAYGLLRETLAISNGGRQLVLTVPTVTGLASISASLAIGQRMASSPWLAVAKDNSVIVRTAQSRLYIDAGLPGASTLGLLSLRLPIYIQLAAAQARLSAIACHGGPATATVTLDVMPSIGSASIADLDTSTLSDFSSVPAQRRALIAHALIMDITGLSQINFGGTQWQSVQFTRADIDAGTIHTVSTTDLSRGVVASLVSGIDLRATALGFSIVTPAMTAPAAAALATAAPALDGVLNQLTGLLGLGLGQADVRVDGVRCGKPTLVG